MNRSTAGRSVRASLSSNHTGGREMQRRHFVLLAIATKEIKDIDATCTIYYRACKFNVEVYDACMVHSHVIISL